MQNQAELGYSIGGPHLNQTPHRFYFFDIEVYLQCHTSHPRPLLLSTKLSNQYQKYELLTTIINVGVRRQKLSRVLEF